MRYELLDTKSINQLLDGSWMVGGSDPKKNAGGLLSVNAGQLDPVDVKDWRYWNNGSWYGDDYSLTIISKSTPHTIILL